MLTELETRINNFISDMTKETYGHYGIVLRIKLQTLRWVLEQIKELECGQMGNAAD